MALKIVTLSGDQLVTLSGDEIVTLDTGLDNAEARRSVSGIWIPLIPGVTPNSAKDAEWRAQAGWSYSGLLIPITIVPLTADLVFSLSSPTISVITPSTDIIPLAAALRFDSVEGPLVLLEDLTFFLPWLPEGHAGGDWIEEGAIAGDWVEEVAATSPDWVEESSV